MGSFMCDSFWGLFTVGIFSGKLCWTIVQFVITLIVVKIAKTINWDAAGILLLRVSKSCNHAITRLRKTFENLGKFWTNEHKTCFMPFPKSVSAGKIYLEHLDCATKFTFRQSGYIYSVLFLLVCGRESTFFFWLTRSPVIPLLI